MTRKKYVLVDASHWRFNVWKRVLPNGNSYLECFWKDENPNKLFPAIFTRIKEATRHGEKWPYFKNDNLDKKVK